MFLRGRLFTEKEEPFTDVYRPSRESGERPAKRFLDQLDYLASSGLLENTFAVFISDHGEFLGHVSEARLLGHTHPLVQELVDVPFVIAGSVIPDTSLEGVYSDIDIVSTACNAPGTGSFATIDGLDAWE